MQTPKINVTDVLLKKDMEEVAFKAKHWIENIISSKIDCFEKLFSIHDSGNDLFRNLKQVLLDDPFFILILILVNI